MKLKKANAILTAVIMTASLGALFGCGEPEPAAGTNDPVVPTVETPAAEGSGTLGTEVKTPEEGGSGQTWVPEIIDPDDPENIEDEIDDSVKYTYNASTVAFTAVSGGFTTAAGSGTYSDYTVTATNSMAVCEVAAVPFPYGTISCKVKNVSTADSGLVFGLSGNGSYYWEGAGVSYYFFFLSRDGNAYLGKTDNGIWSVCKYVSYAFKATEFYELKVVYKGNKICCYVNGELQFAYRDANGLTGTGFGIRGGASTVEFKDIAVTNDYQY